MEKFETKSADELSKMEAQDLAVYYNDLNAFKTSQLEAMVESKATKEDIDSLKSEMKSAQVEQLKSLNETLKQHGLAIKKMTEIREDEVSATEGDSLLKALEDHREALKGIKGNSDKKVSFKAAGTMLSTTNVSGGNVPVEQRLAGLDMIPSRTVRLLDIVSRGSAESPVISWVSQANKDGAAGQTAEGDLKNQIDFDLVVNQESLKKTTAYIKISDEMLGDISFMNAEINNELVREILKKVEEQVYTGDNTGNNLNGIFTQASAFIPATAPSAVENANLVDVLRTASTQIKIANQDAPTYHLLNPSDVLGLLQIKRSTTDRDYIDALQMVGGNLTLDGVPIIETTLVAQDTYLTGDFRKATVYDKGSIDIKTGYENDDFTKNLVTILAEWRGLNVIKTNQTTAFVKGTISVDKAALEALPV